MAAESREEIPDPRNLIENDFLLARATSAAQLQPLLVNLTAHTSVNARLMEVTVFESDEVAPLLAEFTESRLYMNASPAPLGDELSRRGSEIAGTTTVPMHVALDPRSGEEIGSFDGSTGEPATFAAFLADVSRRFDRSAKPATDTDLWRRIFELEDEVRSLTPRQGAADGSKSTSPERPR